jgi:anaerobic magnesium-protoporphyrin IX monomethyl ester cyclase
MRLGFLYLQGKGGSVGSTIGPLGLSYLSATLKRDLNFRDQDIVLEVDDPDLLLSHGPDIIGITSFTETFEHVVRHARYFKRKAPDIPIIVGGEHISAAPQSLPETIDIGVIGEGEETLSELMALYLRNEVTHENLEKVNGIVYWHKGQRVQTAPRAWIMDLDNIAKPDRALIHRPDQAWQQPLFTARGCPYKCTYCASTRFWQKTRYHSIPRIIEEIEDIIRDYPQQTLIAINDDLFPLNRKRLRTVVEAIRAKGLHRKVGFTLNTRANVFDTEIVELISAMNAQIVGFGFESASDKILKQLKGKTTSREALKALQLCEKYGIAVVGSYMVGSPDEDWEDLARTYWFIRNNRDRIWKLSVLLSTPFPGTEFWHDAEARNLVDEKFERWNALDLSLEPGESVYLNQHIDVKEFVGVYDHFRHFQSQPESDRQAFTDMHIKRAYYQYLYGRIKSLVGEQPILMLGAQDLGLQEHFAPGQVHFAPVADGKVDLSGMGEVRFVWVVLLHALEKLRQPEQVIQILREQYLAPNGEFVAVSYNVRHLSVLYHLLRSNWQLTPFSIQETGSCHFFSVQSLKRLLQSQQLSLMDLEYFKFSQASFKPFQEQVLPLLAELGLPPESEQEAFSIWLRACPAGLSLAEATLQVISRDLAIGQSGVQASGPIALPHTH